jgi:uncharacterized delta-60 repeat protein
MHMVLLLINKTSKTLVMKKWNTCLVFMLLSLLSFAQTGQIDSSMGLQTLSYSAEIRDIKYLSCGKIMASGLRQGILNNNQQGFIGTYDLEGNMLHEDSYGAAQTGFACDTLNDTLGIAVCSHRDSVNRLVFITTDGHTIDFDMSSYWGFTGLEVFDLKTQRDGNILVAGRAERNGTNQFFISRWIYTQFGTIGVDVNFGFDGVVLLPFGTDAQARAINLQSDNKIIVVGNQIAPIRKGIILRLRANGTLDDTFNGTGYYQYYFGSGNDFYEYYSVAVNGADDIFCAGATQSGGCFTVVSPTHTGYSKLVVGNAKAFYTSAVQGNQYYLAGPDADYLTQNNGYSCVRLLNTEDNNLVYTDTTFSAFNGSNYLKTEMDNSFFGSCVQPDGNLLVCGKLNNYGFFTRLLTGNTATGINDIDKAGNIQLYPNPANESFIIKGTKISSIAITDLAGRIVMQVQGEQRDVQQVDISGLSAAAYMVTVNGNTTLKLLKTN